MAGAIIRETLLAGGQACRPLVASGLSEVFIDPALQYLQARGGEVRFGSQARGLVPEEGRVASLDLGAGPSALGADDVVILAVPPWVATALVPSLSAPNAYHPIVNAHFRLPPPAHLPPVTGVLNGAVEWLFAFPDRLSVTISGADRLMELSREELAALIWTDVAAIAGLGPELPPWQVVRERRATFAATPEQDARRPGPVTAWRNLYVAGDWTDTGLPATIEGAIRSGDRAAALVERA